MFHLLYRPYQATRATGELYKPLLVCTHLVPTGCPDEDFLGFDGNHPIGLIYENEVDIKRKKFEKKGKRLELVPLRIYQSIANHNFRQYQTFHGLLEDEEE